MLQDLESPAYQHVWEKPLDTNMTFAPMMNFWVQKWLRFIQYFKNTATLQWPQDVLSRAKRRVLILNPFHIPSVLFTREKMEVSALREDLHYCMEWNPLSRRAHSCCSWIVLHFTLRVIWWKFWLNNFCTYGTSWKYFANMPTRKKGNIFNLSFSCF